MAPAGVCEQVSNQALRHVQGTTSVKDAAHMLVSTAVIVCIR